MAVKTKTKRKPKSKPKARSKIRGNKPKSKQKLRFNFIEKKVNEFGANCVLQNVRLAFVTLAKPNTRFFDSDADGNKTKGSFEVTMLIPDDKSFLRVLEKTIKSVIEQSKTLEKSADKIKALKNSLKWGDDGCPLKYGEDIVNAEDVVYDGFENHFVIKAKTNASLQKDGEWKTKIPLQLVLPNREAIEGADIAKQFYSGCWADVSCNISGYKAGKNIGVTFYLSGVMKIRNDDRLGSIDHFADRSEEMAYMDDEDDEEEGI